jgi:CHAT domain-containing protein
MGTRVVVASVGLFPDAEETVELMDRFHDRLAAGSTPAEALRSAAWEVPGVAGVSLVCFGAG